MMNVDKSPKNEEEFSLFATSQKKFHSKAALEYSFRIEEMFTTTPMNALFLRPPPLLLLLLTRRGSPRKKGVVTRLFDARLLYA